MRAPIAFLTFAGFDIPGMFLVAIVLSLVAERPFMELRRVLVPNRGARDPSRANPR